MFILFILSFTSGTLADFPKEIRVDVCTGDTIILPWRFTKVQPENVLSVELFKYAQDRPTALVAAFNPATPPPLHEERTVEFHLNSEILLSHANLSDAGDYQVVMTLKENSESYSYHVKVRVSEAPVTTEGGFYAKVSDNIFNPDAQKWQLRLECGAFQSLGHPPVSVVWKTPSGQTVASTSSYNNSIFYLTLPDPIEEGVYSCLLDETSLAITCLPSDSLLKTGVTVNVGTTTRLSLLEGNLESLKGETQSLSNRVILLLKSVDDSKSEIERMASDINVLENEVLVNLTSRWNGIETLVSKLHNVKVNRTAVDELVDRVLNLENRKEQLAGEMSKLLKDKQNLTDAVFDIQSNNSQLTREVNKLSNEMVNTTVVTNLMKTVLDLQTKNSQLTREVNTLSNEKVNTAVVTNLMKTVSDLQTKNRQLTGEMDTFKAEKISLSDTIRRIQTQQNVTTQRLEKVGSTFVIWGRSYCPYQTVTVYSGIVGGSWYDHSGGAANRLCLTLEPEFDNARTNWEHARIYGAEYENMLDVGNDDDDAPCAVCHTSQSVTIMMPGTKSCPRGWINQYSGHLTAAYYGNSGASEYVCVYEFPQSRPGSSKNDNGADLAYVLAECGSLPCPPYQEGKVVTCAVCSQ